jgi:hypothetical protein
VILCKALSIDFLTTYSLKSQRYVSLDFYAAGSKLAYLPKSLDRSSIDVALASAIIFLIISVRLLWYHRKQNGRQEVAL